MVGRNNRFHGRGGLKRLHANGASVRSGSLQLRYAINERRDDYRVAVVVSRKVSKSAVIRNRIRRRIYENVRILSTSFVRPYDLVFIVFDDKLATIEGEKLTKEIVKLCHKAGLVPQTTPGHAIVEH